MTAPAVCLLGGESSGKTTLARQLHEYLRIHHGLNVVLVPEVLREWCESHQRAPRASEQAGIAQQQTFLLRQAQQQPGCQFVISDTSALVVAAYSELYFEDRSHLESALSSQRDFSCQLLMGLDLPWVADGLYRDSAEMRAKLDASLRREMTQAGIGFQTIYGVGEQRLRNALRALNPVLTPILGQAAAAAEPFLVAGRPGWLCEACSDPDCEHRLFTRLL